MADENVCDVTGQILRELRDEIRVGFAKVNEQIAELQVSVAAVSMGQNLMQSEIKAIRESQHIVEHDITGIKMRIDRIEKHTGLVKV